MLRRRGNFKGGTITAIDDDDVSFVSANFEFLPEIADPEYIALTLDPFEDEGEPEIVWVTTHAADSTTVTVERGKEGTVARSHGFGTIWVNAPTTYDFATLVNTDSDVPPVIFVGSTDPETDYDVPDGAVWLDTTV